MIQGESKAAAAARRVKHCPSNVYALVISCRGEFGRRNARRHSHFQLCLREERFSQTIIGLSGSSEDQYQQICDVFRSFTYW